jgi:cyclic pyranopterin phosphate synthase
MPSPGGLPEWKRRFVPAAELRSRLDRVFPLEALPRVPGATAALYRIRGARGRLGFIAPHTAPFCADCNRLRLASDGVLRPCLCRAEGLDLAAMFRAGAPDAEAMAELSSALARWQRKERPDPAVAVPALGMDVVGG